MKLRERFLRIIFETITRKSLQKYRNYSLESVLKHSSDVMGADTVDEIRSYVISQQTPSGAFADKAGHGDLYYTLFGCFVAEALEIEETLPGLKQYSWEVINDDKLDGLYLQCAVILYAKLFGAETLTSDMRKHISTRINTSVRKEVYPGFISMLTFYYIQDYRGLNVIRKLSEAMQNDPAAPCPVTAALLVLKHCLNKSEDQLATRLSGFYMKDGSYGAVNQAPAGDLLSTSVALYASGFVKTDIRLIKPDCLAYIDSLYSGGGFCATKDDVIPDIEYTFYGLLALGALSTASC